MWWLPGWGKQSLGQECLSHSPMLGTLGAATPRNASVCGFRAPLPGPPRGGSGKEPSAAGRARPVTLGLSRASEDDGAGGALIPILRRRELRPGRGGGAPRATQLCWGRTLTLPQPCSSEKAPSGLPFTPSSGLRSEATKQQEALPIPTSLN